MTIGERIRLLRDKDNLDMSQTEFAARLGVGRGVIKGIEEGRTEPKPLFLEHVCTIYNVNPEWLQTGEGEMFQTPSADEELAELFGKLLSKDEPEIAKIKKKLILELLKLDDQQFENVKNFAKRLLNDKDE